MDKHLWKNKYTKFLRALGPIFLRSVYKMVIPAQTTKAVITVTNISLTTYDLFFCDRHRH